MFEDYIGYARSMYIVMFLLGMGVTVLGYIVGLAIYADVKKILIAC